MPGDIPARTTSGTKAGDAFNRTRESLRSHSPIAAPGILTSHTVHGVGYEAEPAPGRYGEEPTATPATLKTYVIQAFKPDYMECLEISEAGAVIAGAVIPVAKPFKLRNSVTSENGVTFTYDATTLLRLASVPTSFGQSIENQTIVPRYRVGDWIIVADVPSTGVAVGSTPIRKIDLNVDGRVWAQITA